jgi:N-carbamoylputrescine amidase
MRDTKLRIALVQQRSGPDVEENIERGARSFAKAARAGARLIAFAELAFSRFYPRVPAARGSRAKAEPVPGPITDRFRSLAKQYGIVAVGKAVGPMIPHRSLTLTESFSA